ncbi:MAG: septal ring lytic transglycosylase RlpA family protein [Aliidongia sp.]
MTKLPTTGLASTYSDYFVNKPTSNGEIYTHEVYTSAVLPKERWYVVPMGTLQYLRRGTREVVVKLNDRGAGDGTMDCVLDLSRAAMAALMGCKVSDITDSNAGLIKLDLICIVPSAATPRGPVAPARS